jgi:hypothetical protein
MRVFGKASDFFRLRVIKVTEDSQVDLDWQEDILYRKPAKTAMTTKAWYIVQAVAVDDEEVHVLKRMATGEAAMRFKDRVEELLHELTKLEFEKRFQLPANKG